MRLATGPTMPSNENINNSSDPRIQFAGVGGLLGGFMRLACGPPGTARPGKFSGSPGHYSSAHYCASYNMTRHRSNEGYDQMVAADGEINDTCLGPPTVCMTAESIRIMLARYMVETRFLHGKQFGDASSLWLQPPRRAFGRSWLPFEEFLRCPAAPMRGPTLHDGRGGRLPGKLSHLVSTAVCSAWSMRPSDRTPWLESFVDGGFWETWDPDEGGSAVPRRIFADHNLNYGREAARAFMPGLIDWVRSAFFPGKGAMDCARGIPRPDLPPRMLPGAPLPKHPATAGEAVGFLAPMQLLAAACMYGGADDLAAYELRNSMKRRTKEHRPRPEADDYNYLSEYECDMYERMGCDPDDMVDSYGYGGEEPEDPDDESLGLSPDRHGITATNALKRLETICAAFWLGLQYLDMRTEAGRSAAATAQGAAGGHSLAATPCESGAGNGGAPVTGNDAAAGAASAASLHSSVGAYPQPSDYRLIRCMAELMDGAAMAMLYLAMHRAVSGQVIKGETWHLYFGMLPNLLQDCVAFETRHMGQLEDSEAEDAIPWARKFTGQLKTTTKAAGVADAYRLLLLQTGGAMDKLREASGPVSAAASTGSGRIPLGKLHQPLPSTGKLAGGEQTGAMPLAAVAAPCKCLLERVLDLCEQGRSSGLDVFSRGALGRVLAAAVWYHEEDDLSEHAGRLWTVLEDLWKHADDWIMTNGGHPLARPYGPAAQAGAPSENYPRPAFLMLQLPTHGTIAQGIVGAIELHTACMDRGVGDVPCLPRSVQLAMRAPRFRLWVKTYEWLCVDPLRPPKEERRGRRKTEPWLRGSTLSVAAALKSLVDRRAAERARCVALFRSAAVRSAL